MPKPPSSGGEEEEKPRGEVSEDLCEMALDPELLLLRDDGEEEFGMSGACPGGGFLALWLPSWLCVEPVRACVLPAPSSSLAFCSRSQAGGFRGPVGCLESVRDGVLIPSGHGETSVPLWVSVIGKLSKASDSLLGKGCFS